MSAVVTPIRRLFDALDPASAAATIERATVWPFVCTLFVQHRVKYHDGTSAIDFERTELFREIRQAPRAKPPAAEDIVAALGLLEPVVMRADIFPAQHFDDMNVDARGRYKAEYRAYLLWRQAHAAGLIPADMQPWAEGPSGYDPIAMDERVERWARPGVRFTGD
jgi:hypothetical protein